MWIKLGLLSWRQELYCVLWWAGEGEGWNLRVKPTPVYQKTQDPLFIEEGRLRIEILFVRLSHCALSSSLFQAQIKSSAALSTVNVVKTSLHPLDLLLFTFDRSGSRRCSKYLLKTSSGISSTLWDLDWVDLYSIPQANCWNHTCTTYYALSNRCCIVYNRNSEPKLIFDTTTWFYNNYF